MKDRQFSCLFRETSEYAAEIKYCSEYFNVSKNIGSLLDDVSYKNVETILARFSVLPFYKEVEDSLKTKNLKLLNTYDQHKYIADFWYYNDILKYTPKTWFRLEDVPDVGKFVVKGLTNSRKFNWNSMMFAENKREAVRIFCDLGDDGLIGSQDRIVREYIPLETFEIGINGTRFTNEWRCFFLGDKLISSSYYWRIAKDAEKINSNTAWKKDAETFSKMIAKRVSPHVGFFAIDVAKTESGDWIVIEINDGQMSGLSMIDPKQFYKNLEKEFLKRGFR